MGPKEDYPAFDSVYSILAIILGEENIVKLRMGTWRTTVPLIIRPLFSILKDLELYLRILTIHKKEKVNAVFFFQNLSPLSCLGTKILKDQLLLFIGGSLFYWSYLENVSPIGRAIAYANVLIERICFKYADKLITLSPRMVESIGIGKYSYKTWFALPRLDKDFFKRFCIKKDFKRRRNVIGYVGLLCKRKGVMDMIKSIPLVKTDCEYLIVGGGPLIGKVKSEAKRIEKSIEIAGIVSDDKLTECYNEMKLNVLPTSAEGIPSTIIESMACGTPVLVTPVGGIPDIIVDGETGFLLYSKDAQYIAERISQLSNNFKLLETVSEKGYKYIKENFGEAIILESWRKIFQ